MMGFITMLAVAGATQGGGRGAIGKALVGLKQGRQGGLAPVSPVRTCLNLGSQHGWTTSGIGRNLLGKKKAI